MFFDRPHLHPAPEPQSRSARVYRVDMDELVCDATSRNAVSVAKRNHAKTSGRQLDDLVARKIGHGDGHIDVVVVE
jgi:hypothetical protein